MEVDATRISLGVLMGVGATLGMDAWNLFLKRAFGIPSLDYCLLGRWVRHMPGTFRHASIARAQPKAHECGTGWIVHYAIGVSLALAFALTATDAWLARPTLLPALAYGLGTVVFPFLLLQPALGLGIASARSPKPLQARVKSLVTHLVFGFGLFASATVITAM